MCRRAARQPLSPVPVSCPALKGEVSEYLSDMSVNERCTCGSQALYRCVECGAPMCIRHEGRCRVCGAPLCVNCYKGHIEKEKAVVARLARLPHPESGYEEVVKVFPIKRPEAGAICTVCGEPASSACRTCGKPLCGKHTPEYVKPYAACIIHEHSVFEWLNGLLAAGLDEAIRLKNIGAPS
jgi:hypothetical protein